MRLHPDRNNITAVAALTVAAAKGTEPVKRHALYIIQAMREGSDARAIAPRALPVALGEPATLWHGGSHRVTILGPTLYSRSMSGCERTRRERGLDGTHRYDPA